MIQNSDDSANAVGYDTMRDMLHRRAASSLFQDGVADRLIEASGGHPRDLLRLVQSAFSFARGPHFDSPATELAIRQLASDYRRILSPEDYKVLATIDHHPHNPEHSGQARHLLYNLALLEYNDYYWRSHPVIRTSESYRAVKARLEQFPG